MSQIASFYLLKDGQRQELFDGMAGAQTSRRKVAGGQTGGWLRAAGVVAGGNAKSLADRFAVTAAH